MDDTTRQKKDFMDFKARRIELAILECEETHRKEIKSDETGELKQQLLEEAIYTMGWIDRGDFEKM